MRQIFIFASLFILFPSTVSAYSLLNRDSSLINFRQDYFLRIGDKSLELSAEQSLEKPGESSGLEVIPEANISESNPEISREKLRLKSYWIPIIWDFAPIPVIVALDKYCSEKPFYDRPDCYNKVLLSFFIAVPLWSIPPTTYAFHWPEAVAYSGIKLSFMIFVMGMDEFHSDYHSGFGFSKERYGFGGWIFTVSLLQMADIIFHAILVTTNNISYKKQQSEKQVYLAPYADKDRAGLAFQVSF